MWRRALRGLYPPGWWKWALAALITSSAVGAAMGWISGGGAPMWLHFAAGGLLGWLFMRACRLRHWRRMALKEQGEQEGVQ